MLITRITKIVMCLVLAVFCLLVTFDNIADYNANYEFVQHVMSMDTTFPGNELRYRAITSPTFWRLTYAAIIIGEGLAGALFIAGVIRMARALHASGTEFNRAKAYAIAGALVAFLVWFFGFMVVAGEWFDMWQSQTWNGQEAAFRFYMGALAVLILLNQSDPDLPANARREGLRHDREASHRRPVGGALRGAGAWRPRGRRQAVRRQRDVSGRWH